MSKQREWKLDEEIAFLEGRHKEGVVEGERAAISQRSKDKSFLRHVNMERKELELLKQLDEAHATKIAKSKYEMEEKLAQEMDQIKRKEICDIKLRQQLRTNSIELRELETKLKCAYAAKELAFQKKQQEASKLEERIREIEANDAYFRKLRTDDVEYDNILRQEELDKKLEYKQGLHDQMIMKEQANQQAFEEFLIEKKLLDDVAQRLHDEDERLMLIKMDRQKRTIEEMTAFKAAREVWRKKERDAIVEENIKIQKYMEEQRIASLKSTAAKQAKEEAKAKVIDAMAKRMYKEQCVRKEREDIRQELMEEEFKAAIENKRRMEIEKEMRLRLDSSTALDRQLKEQEEKVRLEAEEDKRWGEITLAQAMADRKMEQMTNERRRREMIEVRKFIEKSIIERREQRAQEIQKMWRLKQIEEEDENMRLQRVEEERVRLLKEHVGNLIGYIPNGILRESDLQHFDPEVVAGLNSLKKK